MGMIYAWSNHSSSVVDISVGVVEGYSIGRL